MTWTGAGGAQAAEAALDLLDVAESYRADFTVSSTRGVYQGRVWHQPGQERREVDTKNGPQAVLIDRTNGTAHLIGPNGVWSVGLSLPSAGALVGGLDSWRVERHREGEERVGAIRASRWATTAQGPYGRFDGRIWLSPEGILVKADGRITNGEGDGQAVTMTLSNLKIDPIDPLRFELPQGGLALDFRQVPPEQIARALEQVRPLLGGRKAQ
jgi:hypothetical protein